MQSLVLLTYQHSLGGICVEAVQNNFCSERNPLHNPECGSLLVCNMLEPIEVICLLAYQLIFLSPTPTLSAASQALNLFLQTST